MTFTPTPTSFVYYPQAITGQDEIGTIVMLGIAAIMIVYFALCIVRSDGKK